jgi:hypothetical protein
MSLPLPAAPLLTRVPAPAIPPLTLVVPPPPRISVVPAAPGPTTLVPAVGLGSGVVGPVPSSLQAIANRPPTTMNSHLLVTSRSHGCMSANFLRNSYAGREAACDAGSRPREFAYCRPHPHGLQRGDARPSTPAAVCRNCCGVLASCRVGGSSARTVGSQPPVRRPVSQRRSPKPPAACS